MKNCEDCKEWANLMHKVLPSLWTEMRYVGHILLNDEDRIAREKFILGIEQKVYETIGKTGGE